MSENPKVFISYSHESADFEEKVLEFSNKLRSDRWWAAYPRRR